MDERRDDFEERRAHLAALSEEALEKRFWELANELTGPLTELARTHTSPSVERSVLLRMGFSSVEARAIVEQAIDRGLLGTGAGHLVYRVAHENQLSIRDAGVAMIEGEHWDELVRVFRTRGRS